MISFPVDNWKPSTIKRVEAIGKSSMGTALVVTDEGDAYVKPMGTNRGPHPLACEFVGSSLARWFGLPVPDFAVMNLDEISAEMIIEKGGKATVGPAFTSRRIHQAIPWDGSNKSLEKLENSDIIPRLVVFDTWTRNWDRCPPAGDNRQANKDNILLAGRDGKLRLWIVDQGECFSHGGELNERIAGIERKKDERIYGLFEEFKPFVVKDLLEETVEGLRKVETNKTMIENFVNNVPSEWEVNGNVRKALSDFIFSRASFLSDNNYIVKKLQYCNGKLF